MQTCFALERKITFNETKSFYNRRNDRRETTGNDVISFYQFSDVPDFDVTDIYPTAFSPNAGVNFINILLANFLYKHRFGSFTLAGTKPKRN